MTAIASHVSRHVRRIALLISYGLPLVVALTGCGSGQTHTVTKTVPTQAVSTQTTPGAAHWTSQQREAFEERCEAYSESLTHEAGAGSSDCGCITEHEEAAGEEPTTEPGPGMLPAIEACENR